MRCIQSQPVNWSGAFGLAMLRCHLHTFLLLQASLVSLWFMQGALSANLHLHCIHCIGSVALMVHA